jgi:hypothetical protein
METVETVMIVNFLLLCYGVRHAIMCKARHFLHPNYA